MIKRKGDLFTSTAPYLAHGVNCKGVMGAGIAKGFKDKYPDNYERYKRACDMRSLRPGMVYRTEMKSGISIVNMATQDNPGADARYAWVFESGTAVAKRVLKRQDSVKPLVAVPMIGCGIGGLVWENVEPILRTVEILNPGFEWEVWKFE